LAETHVLRSDQRILGIVLSLTALYLIAEVVGGLLTNSLALLSDAGHMVSDVGGLIISLVAVTLACRPATPERPFGLRRLETVAALINGIVLAGIVLYIFYSAALRLVEPPEVQSLGMVSVALGGLVVNLIGAKLLRGASKRSLNIRSAFLHVVTDTLGSIGAIIGGLIIYFTKLYVVDSIVGLLIGFMIIPSTWRLLKDSSNILLEACPFELEIPAVKSALTSMKGVRDVHDIHIWTISSDINSMSAHLVVEDMNEGAEILRLAKSILRDRFNIDHATLQIEDSCMEKLRH